MARDPSRKRDSLLIWRVAWGASRLAATTVSTQGQWLQEVVTDTHISQTVIGMEAEEEVRRAVQGGRCSSLDLAKLEHSTGGVSSTRALRPPD